MQTMQTMTFLTMAMLVVIDMQSLLNRTVSPMSPHTHRLFLHQREDGVDVGVDTCFDVDVDFARNGRNSHSFREGK